MRSPYASWPVDGSLPSAGVVIHCFDGVEGIAEKWRPAVALGTSADPPSTSLIFAEQCVNHDGRQVLGPGKELFGHACANGGVILRPGRFHRVLCGHARDHGAYCGAFCPPASRHDATRCTDAWAVADIGDYVRLETDHYRNHPGWGNYNEFLLDGVWWDAHLPWSIDAFLTSRGDGGLAQRAHAAFLARYADEITTADVPLVSMTPTLTEAFVVGSKFGERGDPERISFGPGWQDRPPYHFESNLPPPGTAAPPSPSPPPCPPPPPPHAPPQPALWDLNERFRTGRPSDVLDEVGVILKLFDGLEAATGRPWEACEGSACHCQGATLPGRVSAMIANRGLSGRADRKGIPLPFADRSGLVLRSSAVAFECLYGVDAASFNLVDPAHPGCTAERCDTRGDRLCYHGTRADDCASGDLCGFVGAPPTAWEPHDLKLFLEMHSKYGSKYKHRTFHAGYNEVIISSARLNRQLPEAIQAFFALKNGPAGRVDGVGVDVVAAHGDFLRAYGLSANQVPLLLLDDQNWDEPFSRHPSAVH